MKEIVFVENHKNFNALRLGLRLAQHLQAEGHEVILAGRKGKLPLHAGVRVREFAPTAKNSTLATAFAKEKANRVISFVSLPACEAAATAHLPYVYVEPENFKEEKAVKNKATLLKNAKKVIVIGSSEKALDKKRYGKNAVRVKNPAVSVEHNAWDKPSSFKKANNVVASGKFAKNGGVDKLLAAWAKLAPAHTSWHLTIWGEGPSKAALKKFIAKHNLQDSTEIVGTDTELSSLLRAADIYVHPALQADDLDTVLDAMASRLPVLAADMPEMQNYITNGLNGSLSVAGKEDALCGALDSLLVDWGKRVGMAVEAEKMKNRFPFEIFASFLED